MTVPEAQVPLLFLFSLISKILFSQTMNMNHKKLHTSCFPPGRKTWVDEMKQTPPSLTDQPDDVKFSPSKAEHVHSFLYLNFIQFLTGNST